MAKNVLKTILRILIFVIVYLLQIYVINNTTFFGVNGDLCLMAVVLTALMDKNYVAYITSVICGITSDILFSTVVCKYIIIYLLVTSILIGLKKMYKQDSKMSIIIFSVTGIVISEVLLFLFNVIANGEIVNILSFVLAILKECIINIFLAFILYLAFKLCLKEG